MKGKTIFSFFHNTEVRLYLILSLISTIASFLKLLIFAKILGPTLFATFSIFEIIAAYGLYLGTFGIFDSASRLIPIYRGQRKVAYSKFVISLSLGGQIIVSLISFFVYLGVIFFSPKYSFGNTSSLILILAGVYAILNTLLSMCLMVVIAQGNNFKFSLYLALKNFFSLVIGVFCAFKFGIVGVALSEISVILVLVIIILKNKDYVKRIIFSIPRSIKLLINGFPFMLNSMLQNLSKNSERLIIGTSLGIQAFGQFTFATVVFTIGIAIQNIVSQYLTPILCFEYGKTKSVSSWLKKIDFGLFLAFLVFICFYPFFVFFLDRFGAQYFSQYLLGISLMKVFFFSAFFQLGYVYQGILIAKNKSFLLTLQAGISLIVSILLCLVGYFNNASSLYYAIVFVINRMIGMVFLRFFSR